jgi:hypothetical protein
MSAETASDEASQFLNGTITEKGIPKKGEDTCTSWPHYGYAHGVLLEDA